MSAPRAPRERKAMRRLCADTVNGWFKFRNVKEVETASAQLPDS